MNHQSMSSPMGLLTVGLAMIAFVTVVPTLGAAVVSLLLIAFGSNTDLSALTSLSGYAAMIAVGLFSIAIVICAVVGPILCLFTPISEKTKTKLAAFIGISVFSMLPGVNFLGIFGTIAYLLFLYDLCRDLDSPQLVDSFNSAAKLLGLTIAAGFAFAILAFISPALGIIGAIAAFLFGALGFARYCQTIIGLAMRANELRIDGLTLPLESSPTKRTGYQSKRFMPSQLAQAPLATPEPAISSDPSEPEKPPFSLEGQEIVKKATNLSGLLEAARTGDIEKVEALAYAGGVDVKGEHELTALHVACISGVMQVVDFLLKKGANIDEPSEGGLTPLFYAIQNNNSNIVGLLLQRGASLSWTNAQGRTPLHWACAVASDRLEGQARQRLVEMLLARGADPNALDQDGKIASQLAEEAGHPELIEVLANY